MGISNFYLTNLHLRDNFNFIIVKKKEVVL